MAKRPDIEELLKHPTLGIAYQDIGHYTLALEAEAEATKARNAKLEAMREIVAWIEELNDLLPWLWKRASEGQNYKHYMAAGETYRFIAKSKECIREALSALEKGKADD